MALAAVALIIVVEFCERLCYYTFQGTQKSWLQDRGYGNAQSSSLNQIFGLLSYASCFFGGWLAETRAGRFRTIAILAATYAVGCYMATAAAHPHVESVGLYFAGTLFFIALGTGGIKPNVCTFGADQIDPSDPSAARKRSSFFMYFYQAINVGAFVAFGFLATVATNGLPPLIPKEDSYFGAYLIAASFMAVALMLYLSGARLYRPGSLLTNSEPILQRCAGALWSGRGCLHGKVAIVGWLLLPTIILVSVAGAFVGGSAMTTASLVLDIVCVGCLCMAHRDNAWLGKSEVAREVARCLDCVPVLLVGNIVFNIQYNSMASVFYAESCQMDTRLGSAPDATQLNGAFFNLGDTGAIILFTPIIDGLCIPAAERCLKRRVSLNMKVYTGIAFACAAQLVAACLEYARRGAPVLEVGSLCAPLVEGSETGEHVPISAISAFWMTIPYALIGIGEILVNPVLQHMAYEGAPANMRSLLQAFNLFAMGGLPNAFSSALTQATAPFTPNNLDDGNLPAVFFINAAIGVAGCGIYWAFSKSRDAEAVTSSSDSSDSSAESSSEGVELPPAGSKDERGQERQEGLATI